MQKGTGKPAQKLGPNHAARFPAFHFLFSICLIPLLAAGCASPGEPLERKALTPSAIADLAAAQRGNSVVLTFTMPRESTDHRPLKDPPSIEIYRAFVSVQAAVASVGVGSRVSAPTSQPALLVTIPSAMVNHYSDGRVVHYTDLLKADDFAQHSGMIAQYFVRTHTSPKKVSADSNPIGLRIHPTPDPIDDAKAEVTHLAIVLSWTPPRTSLGGAAPAISGYAIYRAQIEPGSHSAGTSATATALLQIGSAGPAATSFSDANFEFDKTYNYSIRSFVQTPNATLESLDSNIVVVTPKDIFPPSAPQGLVVILVPAQAGAPATLDLSWAISPEIDIAGYNVYRSEQAGVSGTRANAEPLLTPAFRDMNAVPGHRYFYTVTSVDRSGNESPASAPVESGVPAEN
jgi:hypothetical protein